MQERANAVTFQGKPLTLLGSQLKKGDSAPDFCLAANDLSDLTFGSLLGKPLLIATVPSLDTSVCSIETQRFNREAASLAPEITILTVSLDLPFAQARFCGAEGIDRVVTASDYKNHAFGFDYGVRIKELGLLARAVFVVDSKGKIEYVEIVKEIASEPDYAAALKAVQTIA